MTAPLAEACQPAGWLPSLQKFEDNAHVDFK